VRDVPADDVVAYVRSALPPPPARVLEIGAGSGELAQALAEVGYEVVPIDPEPSGERVLAVALDEFEDRAASFDAAVAVLSLHHVDPLDASCERLAELLRPGGRVVVDEFDVERFDERAAAWWIAQQTATGGGHAPREPGAMVAELRSHLHTLTQVRAALASGFEVGEAVPCAYLHRWELHPALRALEEAEIARGGLPATGARFIATRPRSPSAPAGR
jgi:SAM-dependent methyltransferase